MARDNVNPQQAAATDHSVLELSDALKQAHNDIEAEKTALARILHDDLGGLLVGAIMDLGWVAQQPGHSPAVSDKLARANDLLRAAIDMKRELIENLRPTLLDNVGLFSTLRWHLKASCSKAGVSHQDDFPAIECPLPQELKIGVFRIFQEALKHELSAQPPLSISLEVNVIDDVLHCHLHSQHCGPSRRSTQATSPRASMQQRAHRIGGSLHWTKTGQGNRMHLQVPLTR